MIQGLTRAVPGHQEAREALGSAPALVLSHWRHAPAEHARSCHFCVALASSSRAGKLCVGAPFLENSNCKQKSSSD